MSPPPPSIPEPERREFFLPGGEVMAFRRIPAGSFRMGSRGNGFDEEPVHRIAIEEFWMAETPVTQAQFAKWTHAEKVTHQNHFQEADHRDHPAENMDWREANAFCHWLGRTVPGVPGNVMPPGFGLFCLPTEAEWEYACRAGTETDYYTGDGEAALAEAGWFGEERDSGSTHPVRRKRPNAFHLHDLHGNVDEWCHDLWDADAYRSRVDGDPDPGFALRSEDWKKGPEDVIDPQDDRLRVIRGGAWYISAGFCRSAYRDWGGPDVRYRFQGFRVCLVRGPAAQ
jgi:formylglycine-generating enzyme required for sulfatase activity